MAGRARHQPRHLHARLVRLIAERPSWFTATDLLEGLGPAAMRFRHREVAQILKELVKHRLLAVEGQPRRYRRCLEAEDWLQACSRLLAGKKGDCQAS